jgi:DNA-binding transcriptional MocR family regulator
LKYSQMNEAQLQEELSALQAKYAEFKKAGLNLDMSRGKPSKEQLDLSNEIFNKVNLETGYLTEDGVDCRNYGGIDGIPEMKRLFGEIFEISPDNIIVGDNSSLHLMFDIIAQAMSHGLSGNTPWTLQKHIKFLCPSPGYDRHFAITEYFEIELVTVPMLPTGPDMDIVEELIKDPTVKGMWCVPKYSNPNGSTYSDETVRRLAAMQPAAPDFRIMWDNAYAIHHLYEDKQDHLLNIYEECLKNGNEDMLLMFASTSKVTFPGSGVSAVAASPHNIDLMKKRIFFQTIGPDKINQLRHVRMFPNLKALEEHMKRHAELIRPKFQIIWDALEREVAPCDIASWTKPIGGYFFSFFTHEGSAKKIVALCKDAGLKLTGAGAAYPYGVDPDDSHIRIAPTYPPINELKIAAELFCVAVKIVAIENLMKK